MVFIAYYIFLSLPFFTKVTHVLRTFRKYVKGEEKGERNLKYPKTNVPKLCSLPLLFLIYTCSFPYLKP